MKRLIIAAATILLAACAQPEPPPALATQTGAVTDAAGNAIGILTAESETRRCAAEPAWCVATVDATATFEREGAMHALPALEADELMPWEGAITEAGGAVIFGIVQTRHAMYSGGGASAQSLTLYRAAPGEAPVEVATLSLRGSVDIRACFNEADVRARRDACADQYDFATTITLDAANPAPAPRIVLETHAQTYPGRRSRNEDSAEAPALREADLTHWRDPTCSYRRTFTRGDDGRYAPNEPLPACSDYLEP